MEQSATDNFLDNQITNQGLLTEFLRRFGHGRDKVYIQPTFYCQILPANNDILFHFPMLYNFCPGKYSNRKPVSKALSRHQVSFLHRHNLFYSK